ncbi:transcriptional regulator with XRE-family HTH domain [Inquilinus ginsengisoli]|uniref:Transcriptional regulator with XRE-family HTH domain n=1 Tax=Inquilinus ginsengisoli TaxID=363840 RepID=A0ABU1JUS3_9PROT|nr:helix-turn-helix transcriptional regulator [Inquilinus ginsengisoli]MDR6292371.1 transcriptional regulator with XRE-family HTH domain [Inquilinus ginsengisoli]
MGKMTSTDRAEIIEAEEAFVVDVQFCIQTLMNVKGWTQADLARALDVSPARVSQMFADDAHDLRLRTVARIFAAMGETCRLSNPTVEDRLASDREAYEAEFGDTAPQRRQTKGGFELWIEIARLSDGRSSWREGPGNDNGADECLTDAA